MSCSVLCVHPCFDFWPLADSRLGWSVQEMLGFGPSDVDQGFGRLQEIGATHQMAEAFQAVHTYIGIIKASLNFTPDTSLLADQRNLTQHTLLSLSPASDISTFFSHPTRAATYEACRLAALIFGVGVLFPIPAQNTPLSTCRHNPRHVWTTSQWNHRQYLSHHRSSTFWDSQQASIRWIHPGLLIPSTGRAIRLHPILPSIKYIPQTIRPDPINVDRRLRRFECSIPAFQVVERAHAWRRINRQFLRRIPHRAGIHHRSTDLDNAVNIIQNRRRTRATSRSTGRR